MNLIENVGIKPNSATRQAIQLVGGVARTAQIFEVSRSAIYQWLDRGVPANRVLALSRITQGQVLPEEIRPDVFLDPVENQSESMPPSSGANVVTA